MLIYRNVMKIIEICDKNNILHGTIYPDYGGMLGHLRYRGKDVFYLDEEMLPLSSVLAGGCPILFPFPSKTTNDSYQLNGREYSMPFHGLVKYGTFAVSRSSDESVSIYTVGNEVTKKENYPFDFKLSLTYKIENKSTLLMQSCVENLSDVNLPHYFGWHPYFFVSEREKFKIAMDFARYFDYSDGRYYPGSEMPSLNKRTDFVFSGKRHNQVEISNPKDGYCVLMTMDEAFEVITVCTRFENRICVEPWMGLPDSINLNQYVQYVKPHDFKEYTVRIEFMEK
jgi:galactose mutarotase-like enzyme